jgi:sensor histidine kinase YesM
MNAMQRSLRFSLYWICQVSGWSLASFYWGYMAFFSGNFSYRQGIADFMADVAIGIFLTHCYKLIAVRKKLSSLSLKKLLPWTICAVLMLSVLYMVLVMSKLFMIRAWLGTSFNISFPDFFRNGWLTVFVTGTRLMSIWVLAYHLYHYSQWQIRTARENARLLVIAKEAQLSNLSAQLNPHFFFNALNNIKFLVEEDPRSARRGIDLLSDLLRHSLSNRNELLIPVHEEISLVKDYLELEKLRFEERLHIELDIEEKQLACFIPPLSIQVLVENAIKHGIDKRKQGGSVKVRVAGCDNKLVINIENSGKLGADTGRGIGLINLKERLKLQYPGKAEFWLEQSTEQTVSATIKIRMNEKD